MNVKAIDSNSIRLEWADNSDNEDGFEISNGETTTVGANETSYTWKGLAAGANMCFKARAFNYGGNSAFTPTECATTPGTDTGGKTASTDTTGTTDEIDPTDTTGTTGKTTPMGTTGTDGGGDGGTARGNGGVLGDVTRAVGDTFQNVSRGRLPDTGGGWAVLLLLGAALVGGGWFLVRLAGRSSR